MDKLLIIDGSALLTKCYFGNLPLVYKKAKEDDKDKFAHLILHAQDGTYTNAIFSFMKTLEKIIHYQKPTHLAITFDKTRNTFRKEMYPAYKGHRKGSEAPFKVQKELMPYLLMQMGIKVFISEDTDIKNTFEGDDLIGSLCSQFSPEISISVLTNDHDMLQLVGNGVNIWMDVRSHEKASEMFLDYTQGNNDMTLANLNLPSGVFSFGRHSVRWDMGVYPELIPALKGLAGDSSDNIPGVKGIASKTAGVLLNAYGTIDEIFRVVKNADSKEKEQELKNFWKELGINRPTLAPFQKENAYEMAKLSEKLATIITELRFNITLDDLKLELNKVNKSKIYRDLDFHSLLAS